MMAVSGFGCSARSIKVFFPLPAFGASFAFHEVSLVARVQSEIALFALDSVSE